MRKKLKQLMGVLLSLALVLGLMPGMSLTAYAATKTYTNLMNNRTVVKFNNHDWYIIADDSTATGGTVTLLAADKSFGTSEFDSSFPYSNAYSSSTVKGVLDALTAEGGAFASVKDAIADTDLSDVGVTGAKLYLLSTSEAEPYKNFNFSGAKYGGWWLRSQGDDDDVAAFVGGENSHVYGDGYSAGEEFGVRPALKLNLSSVIFESSSNTFTVESSTVAVTSVTLDKTTVTLTVGGTETLKATVSPDDATDKTVVWTSSDETVATVADGVVTAVAPGTANITVTTTDGSKTATCAVTVNAAAPTVTISPAIAGTVATTWEGANWILTATSNDGYKFKEWTYTLGGSSFRSEINPGTQSQLGTISSITANFVGTITITDGTATRKVNGHDYQLYNGSHINYNTGSVITITANAPETGKVFDKWTTTTEGLTFASETSATTTFTMPDKPVVITATYKADLIPVTITATDKEAAWSADGIAIPVGGMFTITEGAGAATYTVENGTGEGTFADGKLTVTKCGTFTVKVSTAATDTHAAGAETTATLIVNKATPTVTAPTAKTLTYNGSAQELVNAGSTNDGTLYYAVTTENTAPTDESLYTTSIPTKTDAGIYYVWYKVVGDENYNDSSADSAEVRIDKAAPIVTAPTATNPTYTGSAQDLITAGTTTGGEVQYSTDGSTYSTGIPQGTDVKTYTVYYKVVGDTNYNDVAAQTLTVTIAAKAEEPASDNGTVEIPADEQAGNFAAAGLENTAEELKSTVLTNEDKAAMAAGKDVAVWLEMKDNSANVASKDKTLVVSTVTQSLGSDYKVGTYLDLTLWKKVTGEDKVKVAEVPNGKVKVTMTIPENLRKAGATYKIIRIHNGVAAVIDATVDETTWKLTFETDEFSTYALAYNGAAATAPALEEESDWLEPFRTKLHNAGEAGGAQTVEFEGDFALPREFMEYLKAHPQITLVYHVNYKGEEFTVTIPGKSVIVEESTDWYGPLGLRVQYPSGNATAGAANAGAADNVSKTVTAPKTGEPLHGYSFWLILIVAGAFGAAGAVMTIKKKNKFFVSDK